MTEHESRIIEAAQKWRSARWQTQHGTLSTTKAAWRAFAEAEAGLEAAVTESILQELSALGQTME